MLQSLLSNAVQFGHDDAILVLNSATDPFVRNMLQGQSSLSSRGHITLAEDSIVTVQESFSTLKSLPAEGRPHLQHIPFHEYTAHNPPGTMNVALMNLLYQPGNSWMLYGLELARYALKPGGCLYVSGAKDRGILTITKRMQEYFGNVETLDIKKGHRLVFARQDESISLRDMTAFSERQLKKTSKLLPITSVHIQDPEYASEQEKAQVSDLLTLLLPAFAKGELDEGTKLLLEALEVYRTDEALDIGCGAGFLGLDIARQASKGTVTMVDASLASLAVARQSVEQSGLKNIEVLASDGTQAVLDRRFDLIVTNPPFHLGGIQTTTVAERFIREAAKVLRPRGRFYLVANRFLKYEPTLRASFKTVEEVGGNKSFKVLKALL